MLAPLARGSVAFLAMIFIENLSSGNGLRIILKGIRTGSRAFWHLCQFRIAV